MKLSFTSLRTPDTNLASALVTLGIPLQERPVCSVENGNEQFIFFFEDKSDCGEFNTRDMIEAWYDDEFIENNPKHPMAFLKQGFLNRKLLLDDIMSRKKMIVITKGNKTLIAPEDTSEENLNKLIKH